MNNRADLSRNCCCVKTANSCNMCDKWRGNKKKKISRVANLKIPVGWVSISAPASNTFLLQAKPSAVGSRASEFFSGFSALPAKALVRLNYLTALLSL